MGRINVDSTRVYPVDYMFKKVDEMQQIIENDIIDINEKVNGHDSQLADIAKQLINIKSPPKGLGLSAATGDGITDDTINIQTIIDYAVANKFNVYIPDGVYMIKATSDQTTFPAGANGGLKIQGSIEITMHPNAVLKAITGNQIGYNIVSILNASKVVLKGGMIQGERNTHIGTTGEFGHGLSIAGSSDVRIKDCKILDCWGDGLNLGYKTPYNQNSNIYIDGVKSINNRRQGMSIIDGKNIYITKSEFSLTNGTAPQYGIDIEPDGTALVVTDVFIDNCIFESNTGGDVVIGGGNGCRNINISNNIFKNGNGGTIAVSSSSANTNSEITIVNNIINQITGTTFQVSGAKNVIFSNNTVKGVNTDNSLTVIYIKENCENLNISNNTITNCRIGVVCTSDLTSNVKIKNNLFDYLYTAMQPNLIVSDYEITGNTVRNISNLVTSIYARFTDSIISNNKFSNLQGRALQGSPIKCEIKNNRFSKIGLSDINNLPIIHFDTATAVENIVEKNIFLGDSTQPIRSMGVASVPNLIIDNIARYTGSTYSIDPSNISINNYTNYSLAGSIVWDVSSLADGIGETSSAITITGASLGDYVMVSAPYDLQGITCNGYVSAANTVKIRLQNETGSTIDLASGTWKVRVVKS